MGRTLVTLESSDQSQDYGLGFSPDGRRLVTFNNDGVHVWDLPRIRAQLVPLGLDWDRPPYAGTTSAPRRGLLSVRVLDK